MGPPTLFATARDKLELRFLLARRHLLSEPEQLLLAKTIEALAGDGEREKLRSSFLEFTKAAWEHVEDSPIKMNWHVEMICRYVQACEEGDRFENLIVNVPPGTGKSTIISVLYPAWAWTRDPSIRFFTASYAQSLSDRDTTKCRKLITGDWYQKWFGKTVRIGSIDRQSYFNLSAGGWRMSSTPGGAATGNHPHRIVLDDINSAKKAESERERNAVNEWWDLTMSTRGAGLDRRRIGVQQRFHTNDWTGYTLKKDEDWAHLCLPMRWEPNRMKDIGLGMDPRTSPGELMWPGVFDEKKVRELERSLGIYGAAGQFQQRPTARSGALFKLDEINIIELDAVPMKKIVRWKRYWDKAGTKNAGDYTAGALAGITGGEYPRIFVVDLLHGQWSTDEVERQMLLWSKLDEKRFGFSKFETVFEEEPGASGVQAAKETKRRLRGRRVRSVRATNSKIVRAEPLANAIAAGEVYFVEGPWVHPCIEEMRYFPKGDHDDRVDALSGVYMQLVKGSSFDDATEEDDIVELQPCANPNCNRIANEDTDHCCDSCREAEIAGGTLSDSGHCPECAYRHSQLYGAGEWSPHEKTS